MMQLFINSNAGVNAGDLVVMIDPTTGEVGFRTLGEPPLTFRSGSLTTFNSDNQSVDVGGTATGETHLDFAGNNLLATGLDTLEFRDVDGSTFMSAYNRLRIFAFGDLDGDHNGTFFEISDSLKDMFFSAHNFVFSDHTNNFSQQLFLQAAQSMDKSIGWPNTPNASDTLATLYDIRQASFGGGGGGPLSDGNLTTYNSGTNSVDLGGIANVSQTDFNANSSEINFYGLNEFLISMQQGDPLIFIDSTYNIATGFYSSSSFPTGSTQTFHMSVESLYGPTFFDLSTDTTTMNLSWNGGNGNSDLLSFGNNGMMFEDVNGAYTFTTEPTPVSTDTTTYKILGIDPGGKIVTMFWDGAGGGGGGGDTNFGISDITFTGSRTHNGNGFDMSLTNLGNLEFGAANYFLSQQPATITTDTTNNKIIGINTSTGKLVEMFWNGAVGGGGGGDTNFGISDITFTGNRTHNGGNFNMTLTNFKNLSINTDSTAMGSRKTNISAGDILNISAGNFVSLTGTNSVTAQVGNTSLQVGKTQTLLVYNKSSTPSSNVSSVSVSYDLAVLNVSDSIGESSSISVSGPTVKMVSNGNNGVAGDFWTNTGGANGSGTWKTFFYKGSFTATGTATTTFTVTIGTTQANTSYNVSATPLNTLSAAPFFVTNKTTTTFDVTYLSGLTGSVRFDWEVFP